MQTNAKAKVPLESAQSVAAPWHTAVVLVAIGVTIVLGFFRVQAIRAAAHPDRIHLYGRIILSDWLLFGFVLTGLWLHGSSPLAIVGDRWRSAKDFFRDVGIGVLFLLLIVSVSSLLGGHGNKDGIAQLLLPKTRNEMILWLIVSVTAGVCEEAIYRGYLQKQIAVWTRNVSAGIFTSAILFGLAHAYQGLRRALTIAILGAMAGVLAHWRRSLRPGMIAHVLQDVLAAFIIGH